MKESQPNILLALLPFDLNVYVVLPGTRQTDGISHWQRAISFSVNICPGHYCWGKNRPAAQLLVVIIKAYGGSIPKIRKI